MALGPCLHSGYNVFAQTDQSDQTASKLEVANTAVEQAFNAVLDAEKAGANVTILLAQLNNAANILAQAENSNRTGDFNTAATQADSVITIAQQVTAFAQASKQAALVSGQNAVWSTIASTVIGASVFLLVLFQVWRRFKRSYISKLYESKPEVSSHEA